MKYLVLLSLLLASCGPSKGPLGVHEGDLVTVGKSGWTATVKGFGSDWLMLDSRRLPLSEITQLRVIRCSH